jgi:hypothetical protein
LEKVAAQQITLRYPLIYDSLIYQAWIEYQQKLQKLFGASPVQKTVKKI